MSQEKGNSVLPGNMSVNELPELFGRSERQHFITVTVNRCWTLTAWQAVSMGAQGLCSEQACVVVLCIGERQVRPPATTPPRGAALSVPVGDVPRGVSGALIILTGRLVSA